MKDEQFELLMKEIKELNEGQERLMKEINKIKEGQKKLEIGQKKLREDLMNEIMDTRVSIRLEINEVKREVERKYDMMTRQQSDLSNTLEKRYQESLEDRISIHEDLKTLHTLWKQNQIEHKRYNAVLCEEETEYNND